MAILVIVAQRTDWIRPRFDGAQNVAIAFPLCSAAGYAANCVVDGDTIRIGDRRVRLTGFDAPEMQGRCAAESAAALQAQAELARWLAMGPFQLDGGADPPRDRYGRELRAARRLSASGQSQMLADHMISANLAEGDYHDKGWSDDWGRGRVNWC